MSVMFVIFHFLSLTLCIVYGICSNRNTTGWPLIKDGERVCAWRSRKVHSATR
jgi:hypothetical protein